MAITLPRILGKKNSPTIKHEWNQVKFHSKVTYLNMHIKSKYKYKIMQLETMETWHCNVSLKFHTNKNDKFILKQMIRMSITYCSKLFYNNTHTKPHANIGSELLVTEAQYLITVIFNSPVLLQMLLGTMKCGQILKLIRTRESDTTWRWSDVRLLFPHKQVQWAHSSESWTSNLFHPPNLPSASWSLEDPKNAHIAALGQAMTSSHLP
jgi:hypothetical protein